jgi:outer membrane protein
VSVSSSQAAPKLQRISRAEAQINRDIGNPILLDKIVGLEKGLIGMKVFAVVVAFGVMLSAAPSVARAQAQPPAQPAPATPKPAVPAAPSTQKPAPAQPAPGAPKPAQPATQPQPKVPFQVGLKYAYVQLEQVAQESAQGKAFNAKVQALQEQKVKELQDKNKALQAAQEKLEKGASVLNDSARAALQADIEKLTRDIQRFTEDAQQEIQSLTQQLQGDFERIVLPAIDKVAKEKQVHFVFDASRSGLVWADPGMNLTQDVIKAIDAAAAAPKPAPAAAPQK